MNTASESSAESVDEPRAAASGSGLAASTLRALRAGNRDELITPTPSDAAIDEATVDDTTVDDTTVDEATVDEPAVAAPVPAATAKVAIDVRRSKPQRSLGTMACAALAVAALVFALVAGVLWWRAGHSSERRIGIAREQVVADARLAIVTVNTSDYRNPTAALTNWLGASTGSLHDQFSQSRTTAIKLLAEAKMVTKATILGAAVTSLDLKKGTATVIASVNVTRTPVTGSVSTVRNRFRASMTRTGGQWKLSNLAVVAVALS